MKSIRAPGPVVNLLDAAEKIDPSLRASILPRVIEDYCKERIIDRGILDDDALGSATKAHIQEAHRENIQQIKRAFADKYQKEDKALILEGAKEALNATIGWVERCLHAMRENDSDFPILAHREALSYAISERQLSLAIGSSSRNPIEIALETESALSGSSLLMGELTIRHILNDWQVKHQIFLEPEMKEKLVRSMLKDSLFAELLLVGGLLPEELSIRDTEKVINSSIRQSGTLSPEHIQRLLNKAIQQQRNKARKEFSEDEPVYTQRPKEEPKPSPAESLSAQLHEFFKSQYPDEDLPTGKLEKLVKFFEKHWGSTVAPATIMRELTFALLRPFSEDPSQGAEQLHEYLVARYRSKTS